MCTANALPVLLKQINECPPLGRRKRRKAIPSLESFLLQWGEMPILLWANAKLAMKKLFFLLLLGSSFSSFAQQKKEANLADTSILAFDDLIDELDVVLDEMTKPRSFALLNVGVGNGYFNFQRLADDTGRAMNKLMVSPSLSYFHKSGLGLTAEADMINDGEKINPYQASLTGSFDYLRQRAFATGISLTHYFQKTNLPFYTSPLKSDAFFYFQYRKYKLRPSVNLHYGWGSKESVQVQEERIRNLRITRTITTVKQVSDINLTTSLRYIFNWPNVLSKKDYLKFTPQVSLISGTQQFGFNQVSNIATTKKSAGKNTTVQTENLVLNDNMRFQPLSLTSFLRMEYAKGIFFIQPQVALDYYFPATRDKFTVSFQVNTGVTLH